ncbi:MAG: alanine--tRNA ligase [Deltaproteobacteria bacterium]|nr:alanine--tRNA ligase [Deltaproteobacteria bacterium]
MDYRVIRETFLNFFKNHDHEIVASSSLVPHNDPTLLFTNAGMVQFKGLFLGNEQRRYTRAATSQKCVRAGGKHNDLENVGHTARHHTFFEMLGNFSFGDYFKVEAISWAWELLLNGYKLDADRLYVSVYKNDDEAYHIWQKEIGMPAEKIVRLGEKDNFWAMGDTGPCGPCSEILIDQGESIGCGRPECAPGCDCDRYLEIWNLVFTQFDRDARGTLTPLPRPNIDTGMGLERLAAVVQHVTSNYDTDLFRSIIGHIEDLAERKYGDDPKQDLAFRVIADHSRAAAFLIGDGIMPSNEGRGYVLRRIIRRAIRYGQALNMKDLFFHRIADAVVDIMGVDYNELIQSRSFIEGVIINEEKRFADTLHYSLKILGEEVEKLKERREDTIPGEVAFRLYDTYGLSVDIVGDVARDEGLKVDMAGYQQAMAGQKSQSQESWKGSGEDEIPEAYRKLRADGVVSRFVGYDSYLSKSKVIAVVSGDREVLSAKTGDPVEIVLDETPFYGQSGGQVGDSGQLTGKGFVVTVLDTIKFGGDIIVHKGIIQEGILSKGENVKAEVDEEKRRATALNHSATHLLHAALRELLGEHVKQAGSFVSPDRLRFDFSHFTQTDPEKLLQVEALINQHIRDNVPICTQEMSREEAMETGAMAIFEERYGERVRLVNVGPGVSMELCGGTHTARTGDIGFFKIVSESAVGANLRRIEALTGKAALEFVQNMDAERRKIASLLKTSPDHIQDRVEKAIMDLKQREKEIESLKSQLLSKQSGDLLAGLQEVNGTPLLARIVTAPSPKELREFSDRIKDKLGSGIIVLGAKNEDKVMLICTVSKDLIDRYKAGDIIGRLSNLVGGKGGGRPDMAQGGGNRPDKLEEAIKTVHQIIQDLP